MAGTKRRPVIIPQRRLYYGCAGVGKPVHAYTKEEWGIGASSGGGDHNLIRSLYFSLFMAILIAPVSLFCFVLGVAMTFQLPIMALVMVFFGLLFGVAFLQCWMNVAEELRGRKARKLKGLPKPWWEAPDEHAYKWFVEHPTPYVPLTLEYFPEHHLLQKQAEGLYNQQGREGSR